MIYLFVPRDRQANTASRFGHHGKRHILTLARATASPCPEPVASPTGLLPLKRAQLFLRVPVFEETTEPAKLRQNHASFLS